VHAHNGETCDEAGEDIEEAPQDDVPDAQFCDVEGEAETDDGQDTGQEGEAMTVRELKVFPAVTEDNGSLADEVHAPDTDQTKSKRASKQLQAMMCQ